MTSISEINLTFCEGADEMRYVVPKQDGNGFFFSNDIKPKPDEGSWLRSIKYKDENAFLFVLDIDTKKFDRNVFLAARGLHDTIKNYLHVVPILKASGSKGVQLIFKLKFDENVEEHTALKNMRDLAYTLYKITTPEVRKRIRFDATPGIDCAMYTKKRMVRSFCKHLGSNMFSVPYKYEDDFKTVKKRMNLDVPPIMFDTFPEVQYNDEYVIYEYTTSTNNIGVLLEELPDLDPDNKKVAADNKIYQRMPTIFKRVVDCDHVDHCLKWPLITYMHIWERMQPKEIAEWLWQYSGWKDLSNVKLTMYHINWTCNWVDSLEWWKQEKSIRYIFPLPDTFLEPMLQERAAKLGWSILYQELRYTLTRYLSMLGLELSEASRTAQ
tara:strand:- start:20548 stop:21693 length:1146 start_codon:yes stop_codon:yes gene_type:complete